MKKLEELKKACFVLSPSQGRTWIFEKKVADTLEFLRWIVSLLKYFQRQM
jgi:hypothetical protein